MSQLFVEVPVLDAGLAVARRYGWSGQGGT